MNGLGGQVLQIILFAIIICCMMIGANRGLFLGIFCAVRGVLIAAATLGVAPVITDVLPKSITVARQGIGYVIALVVSAIVINLLARIIKFTNDAPVVGGMNRLGGVLLGAIEGVIIVWCVLAAVGAFQEYTWCANIVASARENAGVMWLQSTNPLRYILETYDFPVI